MRAVATALFLLTLTAKLEAMSYIVPDDSALIAAAKAIVTGTVSDQFTHRMPDGAIETVTNVLIDERIKGVPDVRTIAIALPGGHLGDETRTLIGCPVFTPGEHVLLFLDRNKRGDWTPLGFALGVFRIRRHVLDRGEIFGWDQSGAPHVERTRRRDAFLAYVRDVVRGEEPRASYFAAQAAVRAQTTGTFSSSSYSKRSTDAPAGPDRRPANQMSIAWRLIGTPGDLDLPAAVDAAIQAWSGEIPALHDSRSATPASGDASALDSEWRIIAGDPHDEVPGSCCGMGPLAGTLTREVSSHDFNNETFRSIVDADIVVQDGMSSGNFSQARLNHAILHEMGHALGLRHADETDVDQPCGEGRNCCYLGNDHGNCVARMLASQPVDLEGLQQWDKDAVHCLYDGACTLNRCDAPIFVQQPRDRLLLLGQQTLLTVFVSGTPPFTHQWYAGLPGDVSNPLGTGDEEWSLSIRPTVSSSYWMRVSNACGAPVDSAAANVTVAACPDVFITNATATNKNGTGGLITLNADAIGSGSVRYRWFRGSTPGVNGTNVGTGKTIDVTIDARTSFWATAENPCQKVAVSELVFADTCGLPSIVAQPFHGAVEPGGSAVLSLTLGSSGGTVTWYRGTAPDKSHPAGSGTEITVGPLTEPASYWASVTNACGEIPSRTVTIGIASRRRGVRH